MSKRRHAGSSSCVLALLLHLTGVARHPADACNDPSADNYDGIVGTPCVQPPRLRCLTDGALNQYVGPLAGDIVSAPWLCQFAYYFCNDSSADNYRPDIAAATNIEMYSVLTMCQYGGCNDTDGRAVGSR